MKYLVVSDNHGDRVILEELVKKYQGKIDAFFHCGDSELPASDSLWKVFHVVGGNCDFDSEYKGEQLIDTGKDKIYLTHGHLLGVNFSLDKLSYRAEELGASIALFGHTHQLGVWQQQHLLLVNSGSICLPRGKYPIKTYAIIEEHLTNYQINYYTRDHQEITELTQIIQKIKD